uniref:FMRFamide-related neuropeptides-like n=1 Tax=Rhabditophanes sp. KR3021 TaxID=114890 RepID=A0AC35U8Y9_9BILA
MLVYTQNIIKLLLCSVVVLTATTTIPNCCKTNPNSAVCSQWTYFTPDEQAMIINENLIDTDCSVIAMGKEKRKPNFIRYGRSSGQNPTALDKKASDPNFLRFGRSTTGEPNFLRFGRAAGDNNFLRFGKSASPDFLRFGKRSFDNSKEPNFLRFGKRNNFLRFGRSQGDEDQFNREYRKPNFLRFGKRSGAATNFLRFGRATAFLENESFARNYRQQPDFLRFGK